MWKKVIKLPWLPETAAAKAPLLKIIAGLDTADSGTVWVHKDIKVVMLQQDNDFEEIKPSGIMCCGWITRL